MARGIIDCNNQIINVGDRVRTASGDVIEVKGGMVSEHAFFNAETCTKVDKHTKLTGTGKFTASSKVTSKALVPLPHQVTDCIIWGD